MVHHSRSKAGLLASWGREVENELLLSLFGPACPALREASPFSFAHSFDLPTRFATSKGDSRGLAGGCLTRCRRWGQSFCIAPSGIITVTLGEKNVSLRIKGIEWGFLAVFTVTLVATSWFTFPEYMWWRYVRVFRRSAALFSCCGRAEPVTRNKRVIVGADDSSSRTAQDCVVVQRSHTGWANLHALCQWLAGAQSKPSTNWCRPR